MNVTIYLPNSLADEVRAAAVNVSAVCQRALRGELGERERGADAARTAIADARLALDRAEAAVSEPSVVPDAVGMEMAGAHQKLAEAMRARLDGADNGPVFEILIRSWHHVAAACRLLDPKEEPAACREEFDLGYPEEPIP
jgi:post-segregation antitoxin (ccd killing protein)